MANNYLHIELATPDKKQDIGEALSCSAPGVSGRFQILPLHAPFISELGIGEVKIELPDKTRHYAVSGGFLEVVDNRVLLLLQAAEPAEDIDVDRAMHARDRAQNRLSGDRREIDLIKAETALKRALNRLKVARKASN